jgi:hypothetical protein
VDLEVERGRKRKRRKRREIKHHKNAKSKERKAPCPMTIENGKVEKSVCLMSGRVKQILQREKQNTRILTQKHINKKENSDS